MIEILQEFFFVTCELVSDTCFHDPTWIEEMFDSIWEIVN